METKKVKIRIYGMTCEDCVATIKNGLLNQNGVVDVFISLKDQVGEVSIDEKGIQPEEILKNPVFQRPSHYRATLLEH